MPTIDRRVDDYIARQAPFAQPILRHLRGIVHAACPEVVEAIKWSMPAFTYKGSILCGMAAFKAHATFGFWGQRDVVETETAETAMGQLGRLTSVAELPPEAELAAMVRKAAALVDERKRTPRARVPRPEPATPDDLATALANVPAAQAAFDAFPPSCRREYLEWVIGAKRPETRARRVAEAVALMREGRKLHWKYQR